jgi:hypothetical protein
MCPTPASPARYPGQPRSRRIGPIKLSVAETARLTRLAVEHAAGLISRTGSRSPCAGQPADDSTRPSPDGITTARGFLPPQPDPRQPEGGDLVYPNPRPPDVTERDATLPLRKTATVIHRRLAILGC